MKWYKRDPDAALIGMIGLSDSAYAYYGTLIDLLYSRDGDVSEEVLIKARGHRPQKWRKARTELLEKGKIQLLPDGKLMANRVETELISARYLIEKMAHMGRVSAEKRKENNATPPTARELQPQPQPQPDKKVESKLPPSAGRSRKKPASEMPNGWHPRIPLTAANAADFERFCDHARMHGRVLVDWDAGWMGWQRSQYQQKGSGNGTNRQNGSRVSPILAALEQHQQRFQREAGNVRELRPYPARLLSNE
jgi:hypothetical protein